MRSSDLWVGRDWHKLVGECLQYPNGETAKVVWKNFVTGEFIIHRYDIQGNLIFSNKKGKGFSL